MNIVSSQPVRPISDLYRIPLTMLTDQYQLTMSYVHWLLGNTSKEGVSHLYFRKNPFESGYAIASGLTHVVDFLMNFRYSEEDLAFIASLAGNDGKPLFQPGFINYLADMRFSCDIDAVPEGTVVFPNEPIIRVRGPIIQGHLLETALLNLVNFATLCATKAARIVQSAQGKPCSEQGLRRAQGPDGALMASWAATVGGFAGTSNLLASRLYGIKCGGTMAHALVMSFQKEQDAFQAYADALPNNCVFLVDTYNTINGIKKAIKVAVQLRQGGHEMLGIRLDSGDLAQLSKEARQMLDEAGFPEAKIFVSNDLDEHLLASLNAQGARICVYGIGTKLVTCYDQPALGGVYKLGAVRDTPDDAWRFPIKVSEQLIKTSIPGIQQIRRFFTTDGQFAGDMIFNEADPPKRDQITIHPFDETRQRRFGKELRHEDLLVPIFRDGQCVYQCPTLPEISAYARMQLSMLAATVKRFENPAEYEVGLEKKLFRLRKSLIKKARK